MAELRRHFDFLPEAELAIELDPRTTTPELVATLAKEGINRASLGVQDFDPSVQKLVNRIQPHEQVATVMESLRAVGLSALSLDLMYGLPGQTPDSVAQTARQAVALGPSRLSLFSYAHVPAMKPYQKKLEQAGLPDDLVRLDMEQAARHEIESAGFVPIGIDHFARPEDPLALALGEGRLSRNFQGYTDDPAALMLGFGASAISDAGGVFVQNEPDIEIWQQRIVAKELPIRRQYARTEDDHVRGCIIRDLMCHFRAEIPAGFDAEWQRLETFVSAGLAQRKDNVLEVDTTRRMVVRVIAAVFDTTFNPAQLSSKVA
jgi:oxygen-independent coproporphyrinogen-3 oxidase